MSSILVNPYKKGSSGAKALADGLSQTVGLKVRRYCTEYKPTHKIINWGVGNNVITSPVARIVNPLEAVKIAGNKLRTFQALEGKDGIRIPQFTTDINVATGWLRDGTSIVCRTVLSGHSGAGIVLVDDKAATLPAAPLFVQ